jgi:hypothetical protein
MSFSLQHCCVPHSLRVLHVAVHGCRTLPSTFHALFPLLWSDQWSPSVVERDYLGLCLALHAKVVEVTPSGYWRTDDDPVVTVHAPEPDPEPTPTPEPAAPPVPEPEAVAAPVVAPQSAPDPPRKPPPPAREPLAGRVSIRRVVCVCVWGGGGGGGQGAPSRALMCAVYPRSQRAVCVCELCTHAHNVRCACPYCVRTCTEPPPPAVKAPPRKIHVHHPYVVPGLLVRGPSRGAGFRSAASSSPTRPVWRPVPLAQPMHVHSLTHAAQ